MRLSPQLSYPAAGFVLGAGAPVGSFLLRLAWVAEVREDPWTDLQRHAFFYLYELIATSLVFVIAGIVAGRRAHRLGQGAAFYHELAEHDALTGLHNDRAFADRYHRALERAVTTQRPLAMIVIDVDELKAINDAFGHASGSRALVHVADALQRSKRASDLGARWGGDEFAILLEGADRVGAMRVAERLLAYLRSTPLLFEQTLRVVTVTIGICVAARPSLASDLFEAADRALFAGKARGRNTIEVVTI